MIYTEYTWIFVCGIFVSMFVAFGIGANDVGNAFGSSVGAKALTMKQAIIVAAFCEFGGASLMGAGVTDTIKGGIAKLEDYIDSPQLLMYGMLCALLAAGMWLILATYWELPVSTTHSIVGAIMGMSIVAKGPSSVLWSAKQDAFPYLKGMLVITFSWVTSPLLSAAMAMILFLITRHGVLRRQNSYDKSLWLFPIYTMLTFWIVVYFSITKLPKYSKTPKGKAAYEAAWIAGVATFISATIGIKWIRYKVSKDVEMLEAEAAARKAQQLEGGEAEGDKAVEAAAAAKLNAEAAIAHDLAPATAARPNHTPNALQDMRRSKVWSAVTAGANYDIHAVIEDDATIHELHANSERFDPRTELSFKYLQVFTACANSFAHGSNDVANSIGPFAAIYAIWECSCVNTKAAVPQWILVLGGAGIVLGLATYGYKIMRVLGVKMTRLTNSRGYCVEMAAALTVIVGSNYGLPLSTTHCMVGAVTGVGLLEGKKGFNYMLLVKFFAGWVATLLVAALTAGAFTAQGLYSPNRTSSLQIAYQGALINSTNYDIAQILGAQAKTLNNATLAEQSAFMLDATSQYSNSPILHLNGPLESLVQGATYLANDTTTVWYSSL